MVGQLKFVQSVLSDSKQWICSHSSSSWLQILQTWWLKTAKSYSLTASGRWKYKIIFTEPKSRCWWVCAPSGDLQENQFPASPSFWRGCQHCLTCGCIIPIVPSLVTLPTPFLYVSDFPLTLFIIKTLWTDL